MVADEKLAALSAHRAVHPRPSAVTDPLFRAGAFFDARDLVQVKYEMLRRVREDGWSVTAAAAAGGLSRQALYQARTAFARAGLAGLAPRRPGPRGPHKLGADALACVDRVRADDPSAGARRLAARLRDGLGLAVHPRSIERALDRRSKRGAPAPA